jgi:uncharacterized membrane protein YbjE (DUF340 family)
LVIILLGAWFGYSDKLSFKFINKKRLFDKIAKLQYFSLLFLLFIMGVNIGINKEIISAFYKLGYQALVLAVFSVAFSIIGVKLISGFIINKREVGSEHNEP